MLAHLKSIYKSTWIGDSDRPLRLGGGGGEPDRERSLRPNLALARGGDLDGDLEAAAGEKEACRPFLLRFRAGGGDLKKKSIVLLTGQVFSGM